MVDFVADFIAGIIEVITKPWVDKMNKKWKTRKKVDRWGFNAQKGNRNGNKRNRETPYIEKYTV